MKIAITGSQGLIGSALSPSLAEAGHQVVRVVRGTPAPGEIGWDPGADEIDHSALDGIEAVIHLAGAGVGDHRWSDSYKHEILRSRTEGTATLVAALVGLPTPPRTLLSASAVGVYGVRGDEVLTERSDPGLGFLADVCAQWEAATAPAADAGIRVLRLRTGVVLSAAGGALRKQLLPFKLGLGARLGRGDHFLSWITRRDLVRAVHFLLGHEDIAGPVNLTSPGPESNATFTTALGRALHRPARLVVPRALLRLAVGNEMTAEFLLASQRVVPQYLVDSGFTFIDASLDGALRVALQDRAHTPLSFLER
jgi:uncharacterized protein (TIGR01777 family)